MAPKAGFGTKPHAIKPKNKEDELTEKYLQWADKKDLEGVLVPHILAIGMRFLDQWMIQMVSAKSDASAPPEESKDYWWTALVGNLLWAASCFVPGAGIVKGAASQVLKVRPKAELPKPFGPHAQRPDPKLQAVVPSGMTSLGKTMYATMALGGATAGSGTVDRLARDPNGAPSGKDVVAQTLNLKRKQMGDGFRKNYERWTSELLKQPRFSKAEFEKSKQPYLTGVEQALWANLFPDYGFEAFNDIYNNARETISSQLGEFNKQYKEWSDNRKRYANVATDPRPGNYGGNANEWQRRWDEYPRIPAYAFKPKLNFPHL